MEYKPNCQGHLALKLFSNSRQLCFSYWVSSVFARRTFLFSSSFLLHFLCHQLFLAYLPSANMTESWTTFWHPRSKRDQRSPSFCTCTEVGSSRRNIHGSESMHLGSRDLCLSEASLLKVIFTPPAVLSCSPAAYTEFWVVAGCCSSSCPVCWVPGTGFLTAAPWGI